MWSMMFCRLRVHQCERDNNISITGSYFALIPRCTTVASNWALESPLSSPWLDAIHLLWRDTSWTLCRRIRGQQNSPEYYCNSARHWARFCRNCKEVRFWLLRNVYIWYKFLHKLSNAFETYICCCNWSCSKEVYGVHILLLYIAKLFSATYLCISIFCTYFLSCVVSFCWNFSP